MAMYVLLPMRTWDGLQEWSPFRVGERELWKATLRIARLTAGGSIKVTLQVSPTGDGDEWSELKTFGVKSAAGVTELVSTGATPDFTIVPRSHVWIRAVIETIVGEVSAEVTFEGDFINTSKDDDLQLLSQELRTWGDGFARVMLEAESDIARLLTLDSETGELDVDLTRPEVHKLIKLEVADQAEYLKRKEILSASHDPSAMVSLRSMGEYFPGAGNRLRSYRSATSLVWRGR